LPFIRFFRRESTSSRIYQIPRHRKDLFEAEGHHGEIFGGRQTSAYNAIFGRTALNELKAVTSTPHLSMKFLTEEGVEVVKGDQKEARRCYNLSLKSTLEKYNLVKKTKEDRK
jgi:hypothetical protein